MSRNEVEPEQGERGEETHPAFGMVRVGRVSSSPGASLFDSEILHGHYVTLRIYHASRKRDLHRDWIHEEKVLTEISMSESQWASMVSSLNSQGTSCTIEYVEGQGPVPGIPFAPRMELSHAEVRTAADRVFADVKAALELVKEKPTKANIRNMEIVLGNAAGNITYAAKALTEHAENVTQKSKVDIEAMIDSRARQLGLDPYLMTLETRGEAGPELTP